MSISRNVLCEVLASGHFDQFLKNLIGVLGIIYVRLGYMNYLLLGPSTFMAELQQA